MADEAIGYVELKVEAFCTYGLMISLESNYRLSGRGTMAIIFCWLK